ncbi:MAG: hypothetical protein WC610_01910 [Patescibacteria group bacterium]
MKFKKSSWLSAGFTMVIIFTFWLAGFNFAYAVWSEPASAPPAGNVAAPLNEGTSFSGDVNGAWNSLTIKGCSINQILKSDGTIWSCTDFSTAVPNLLSVLNAGEDAKAFGGTVYIGEDVAGHQANFKVLGGEIRAKWLHADSASGENTIAGNLDIGTTINPDGAKLNIVGTKGLRVVGNSASDYGAYVSNSDQSLQAYLAYNNTGISAYGTVGGVMGYDSTSNAYGYLGYLNNGVWAYSTNGYAVYGWTFNGNAIYGSSVTGWAGYFTGGKGVYANQICLGSTTDCKTNWSQVGQSQWITSGSNIYYNNGNVGIGTNNPTGLLQLNGGNTVSRFNQGTNDTFLTMNDSVGTALLGSTAGIPFVGSQSNTDFTIRTNNSEKVRITTAGNVGIGTASPNNTIQVAGLINFNNTIFGTFLGYQAGNVTTGNYNSFVGFQAGYSNLSGSNNSAMGVSALSANIDGYFNSAMGVQALRSNISGISNSAMGVQALYANTTGSYNSAMGVSALNQNTTGFNNSAMGMNALNQNTTGFNNSAMGIEAGRSITTGNSNTFLGYGAGNINQKADAVNSMALGSGAYATVDNQVVIGNNSITMTLLKGNVGIGTITPDSRLVVNGLIKSLYNGQAYFQGGDDATFNDVNQANTVGIYGLQDSTKGCFRLGSNSFGDICGASGNVGIGTAAPGQKLEVSGGIRLNPTTGKPACNVNSRGTMWFTQAAADILEVCARNSNGNYTWKSLF